MLAGSQVREGKWTTGEVTGLQGAQRPEVSPDVTYSYGKSKNKALQKVLGHQGWQTWAALV